MATLSRNDDAAIPRQSIVRQLTEVLLIVLVFFAVAGEPAPHVNEAHYLSRLKHFWNPEWCAGDLFLESKEAQLVFAWTFGWATRFLSLAATAWAGRIVTWTLLAWAWQRLSWRIAPVPLASVLSAALFVVLNPWGNLAGEWIVGGVEAKCLAYGFVLLALTDFVDGRWTRMWLLLGAATAYHPIVGGWTAVVCGCLWLHHWLLAYDLKSAFVGLAGFALLAMLGVIPALMLTRNEPQDIVAEACRIYVFERLPHHLALLSLPTHEIVQRIARHAALLAALWMLSRAAHETAARRIAQFAWGSVLLAAAGFAIELLLWNQPLVAARLLRYYWFRLADFAVPLSVSLLGVTVIVRGIARGRRSAAWLLAATIALAGSHIAYVVTQRVLMPVAPADARVRDFAAWLDACAWVAENTPADALFLTPRLSHTFKWRAGRPEVATRKDIPQDAGGIVEWYRRIKDIYYTQTGGVEEPLDSIGVLGTEKVRELALKYRADYVIMDRSQLLSLPREFWNEEYVVYRIDHGIESGPE